MQETIHTDIPSQNILDLFLLESTFDDQSTSTIDGTSRSHLCEQELDDVFRLPMHSLADVSDVCEDGFFVAFSVDGRRGYRISFPGRC